MDLQELRKYVARFATFFIPELTVTKLVEDANAKYTYVAGREIHIHPFLLKHQNKLLAPAAVIGELFKIKMRVFEYNIEDQILFELVSDAYVAVMLEKLGLFVPPHFATFQMLASIFPEIKELLNKVDGNEEELIAKYNIYEIYKRIKRNQQAKQNLSRYMSQNPHDQRIQHAIQNAKSYHEQIQKQIAKDGKSQSEEQLREQMEKTIDEVKKELKELAGRLRGLGFQEIAQLIDGLTKGLIDWKKVLKSVLSSIAYVRSDITYTKVSPRTLLFDSKIIYPAIVKEDEKVKAIVLIDTSASIQPEEYKMFVSELYRLAKLFNVDLHFILFTDRVVDEFVLKEATPQKILDALRTRRYIGGTRLLPALQRAKEVARKDDILIIFTDGEHEQISNFDTRKFKQVVYITTNTDTNFKLPSAKKIFLN